MVTSISGGYGRIKALDHDASTQLWFETSVDSATAASPAVLGNLDGDGYDEVVVAFKRLQRGTDAVVALDNDGDVLDSWSEPVVFGRIGGLYGRLESPQVANVVGVGDTLEVIVGDSYSNRVHILNADGSQTIGPFECDYLREYVWGELKGSETTATVIDADGDGKCEVVYGTNLHQVAVWDPEAEELESGWPIYARESVRGQIQVADIDVEGGKEVIIADIGGWIHVFEYDEVAGFQTPKPRELSASPPVASWLGLSYPNPANPTTVVPYAVSDRGEVALRVYNAMGRLVRELVHGQHEPGRYEVRWDGRDANGLRAASGIYFYELRIDGKQVGTQRMLIVR